MAGHEFTGEKRGIMDSTIVYYLGDDNTFADTDAQVVEKGVVRDNTRQTDCPRVLRYDGFSDTVTPQMPEKRHVYHLFTKEEVIDALNAEGHPAAPEVDLPNEAAEELDTILSLHIGNRLVANALVGELARREDAGRIVHWHV